MLKRLPVVVGAAIAALAVAALLFGTVLAVGPDPKAGPGTEIGGRDIPLAVAADLTGLTEEQLLVELEGGKTIPALLEEKGIDLAIFHHAVAEARQAAVEEAVQQGEITRERAQHMLQRMALMENCECAGPHSLRQGAPYGEPGEGTGPGEAHRYGEPGEGTGPGEAHRYGAARH